MSVFEEVKDHTLDSPAIETSQCSDSMTEKQGTELDAHDMMRMGKAQVFRVRISYKPV